MAGAKISPELLAHLEWIGFVRPHGLVVSAPALVHAGAILNRGDAEGQRQLIACTSQRQDDPNKPAQTLVVDFERFARDVLDWSFSPVAYFGTPDQPVPGDLALPLPEYHETIRPDFAIREKEGGGGPPQWQLLVRLVGSGVELDKKARGEGGLEASESDRLERLLRHTGVPAGVLFNGHVVRVMSAPRGESSGWIDFPIEYMTQTAGRPICAALRLLLGEHRLLGGLREHRLAGLLATSRKFQNEVSERLSEQVLHALYELLRGFQHAHDASKGELLREQLAEHPDDIYRSLLTVILRLVFLLFAEERGMLPDESTFLRGYSLAALYERLRSDAALNPDTMDQRYGAWAQLIALFRMVHDGAESGDMSLPARHGVLFDPDRFPFLEGRTGLGARQMHERVVAPLVPDGTIYRALEKLLVLDGERLSYRALDVEQIGSVYETMMGFRLERASGRSIAIRAAKPHGAPTTIDLEKLLGTTAANRPKFFLDQTDRKLTETLKKPVTQAKTLEELHAALESLVDHDATPDFVPPGAMVLQPSEERRRSGSHYTPRALTEPIVRKTLEPVLRALRMSPDAPPTPEQILALKVCDPAMGSGAFLVETCRQLGDALLESWAVHGGMPPVPADEDEVVMARRMVAPRCLYGVDRNPVAVDLAKVSLWLVTLARQHPLTFVDHALRHGDSLVGLTRKQISCFHWDDTKDYQSDFRDALKSQLEKVSRLREEIRNRPEEESDWALRDLWDEAKNELRKATHLGDLVCAAYFSATKDKERNQTLLRYSSGKPLSNPEKFVDEMETLRIASPPLVSFHWELEYPEVFEREDPGFDAIVGNPPFAGKNTITDGNVEGYLDWLKQLHAESHGNADLVAHFFRRAFALLRTSGSFGLIATNTISQGDTRSSGLRWICQNGGTIYCAQRRLKWPGQAAVVVSVVYVAKGSSAVKAELDGREVKQITAFLFDKGESADPKPLLANSGKSFVGSYILGMGFTFDDTDKKGVASSIADMKRLIAKDKRNAEVIFPYIGGEEVNASPTQAHHRYVIDFFDLSEEHCKKRWPELFTIVSERVRPERIEQKRDAIRERWWQYAEKRPGLYSTLHDRETLPLRTVHRLPRALVISRVGQHAAFAFLPTGPVFSDSLIVMVQDSHSAFCALQSRPHEIWARFFGSSMKDDLRYTPSDCFETFPFPASWQSDPTLEAAGKAYYEHRAALMIAANEGMTQTYNRFHDPEEDRPEIIELRRLHAEMDRAVLAAYGWTDLEPTCDFILDYEDEAEESSRRKKPYRYRWPDEFRDTVLVRLLELNASRAKAEQEESRAEAGDLFA